MRDRYFRHALRRLPAPPCVASVKARTGPAVNRSPPAHSGLVSTTTRHRKIPVPSPSMLGSDSLADPRSSGSGATPTRGMHRSAAVLAMLVLALVACQGGALSAEPTPSGPELAPERTPTSRPVTTHTPSLPSSVEPAREPADLVVRFQTSGLTRSYPTTLVADGRLTVPTDSGYVQQRLSPTGVHAITARLLQSGLLEEDNEISQPLLPDHDPTCGDGLGQYAYHSIELWQDRTATKVTWFTYLPTDFDCYATSPQLETANQLLEELSDPAAWLAPDAWIDPVPSPYTPTRYRLLTARQPWPTEAAGAPQIIEVDWPLADTLLTFGEPMPDAPYEARCGVISNEQAHRVTAALEAGGAQFSTPEERQILRGTYLEEAAGPGMVGVILEAMRPDEDSCDLSILGGGICWFQGPADRFGCPTY